jgi:hypothetical protein
MPDEDKGAKGADDQQAATGGADNTNDNTNTDTGVDDKEASANAAAKKLPWVQELISKVGKMEKSEAERVAAEEEEKTKAAIADAEAKKDYETALQLERDKVAKAEAKAIEAELRAAFVEVGAIDGDISEIFKKGYDPSKVTALEYAKSIKGDETKAHFFDQPKGREVLEPPPKSGGSPVSNLKPENFKEWRDNGTPEQKKAAAAYAREYYDRHGKFPTGG